MTFLRRIHRHEATAALNRFFFSLLQRRYGRAALLPALGQLSVEHDVGVSSTPADRGLRRRYPGL